MGDNDSATCEGCGQRVPSTATTYSSSGQLLCRACIARADVADTEQRLLANRRRFRNLSLGFGGAAALFIGALVVTGNGVLVAYAMMGLGGFAIFGAMMAFRMFVARTRADPFVARGVAILGVVGLGLFLGGVFVASLFAPR